MRYSDFKIVESRLLEQEQTYVIGDSHARAMGGSNNLAANGARISSIVQQARRVPDGSLVFISAGHNDVAAGTNPNVIAREVRSLINSLTARDCEVVYILFPEGTDNPNQENMGPTREAIKSIGVPVGEDLDGCPLSDGVHCQVSRYQTILNSSRPDPEEGNNNDGLTAGPPYPPSEREAVRDMQRKLEELGYSVGSTGIDGKYGPRTSRAVAAYKRDRNITDDDRGRSIPQDQLTALASAEPVEDPSPTGNERTGGTSVAFNPQDLEALDFGGEENEQAREIASEYLGREIDDEDWDMLIRATWAESTDNPQELAAIMGVILNRVRENHSGYGSSIRAQLLAPAQFQAVTGTRTGPRDENGRRTWTGPSPRYRNPNRGNGVQRTAQAVIDHLEDANTSWMNFTANDLAAYGDGTDPSFRGQVARSSGSRVIGGTVFGTV